MSALPKPSETNAPTLEVRVSQTPVEKFREYLASRPRPQRFTGQQRDMVEYIFSKHNHFDADQLIDEMKREGSQVSRATIYRTLNKLVDASLLRRINVGARTVHEHDYGYAQHDHLVCEKCSKMIEFQSDATDRILREVCQANQFQMQGHTLIVRGTCADCNRQRSPKRHLDLI